MWSNPQRSDLLEARFWIVSALPTIRPERSHLHAGYHPGRASDGAITREDRHAPRLSCGHTWLVSAIYSTLYATAVTAFASTT
jgi:hypothetical protein